MLSLLSKLLSRFQPTYLQRVEFAAHVGWSLSFCLAGLLPADYWHYLPGVCINLLWVLYTFYDEFITDGWKGKLQGYDTLWDLGSKLSCQPLFLAIVLVQLYLNRST